jgi:hypothetical protein
MQWTLPKIVLHLVVTSVPVEVTVALVPLERSLFEDFDFAVAFFEGQAFDVGVDRFAGGRDFGVDRRFAAFDVEEAGCEL